MNIKIILAAHKPCEVPQDAVYLPLFVGAAGKNSISGKRGAAMEVFARDDQGDNISGKNPSFCELTGIYWAWKNLDADAVGLVHYRRLFGNGNPDEPMRGAMSGAEYEKAMQDADILVPRKRHYYITTLYRHYADTHDENHLKAAKSCLLKLYPEYETAFDMALGRTWGYMFNMFVAKKTVFDEYCGWLFPLLSEIEKEIESEIDTAELSDYNARLIGRVSELLFNVWIYYRTHPGSGEAAANSPAGVAAPLRIAEIPWYSTTKTPWIKKGTAFLKARLTGEKYEGSF